MTEVERLRALLAEARGLVGFLPTHPAGIDAVIGMQQRIDAALAEPVDLSYTQDDVNRMTDEMIALRKDYEKSAYQRGAEAMREAAAVRIDAEALNGCTGPYFGNIIRALPVPKDKP